MWVGGVGGRSNHNFILTDVSNRDKDHDHTGLSTNPTLYVHSATNPDTDNTQWLSLTHDQTDGVIKSGKGNLLLNASSGLVYVDDNISADDYITRTSVYDKTQGSALNFIQDSNYYKTNGIINHSKFYGYAGKFEVVDYTKPVIEKYVDTECEQVFLKNDSHTTEECSIGFLDKITCQNVTIFTPQYESKNCVKVIKTKTIYPYKTTEEGVSLGSEIDILRQAVYELKLQNENLTARIVALEKRL